MLNRLVGSPFKACCDGVAIGLSNIIFKLLASSGKKKKKLACAAAMGLPALFIAIRAINRVEAECTCMG
jgi:hypothetical protein